jgi:hypothetical protein
MPAYLDSSDKLLIDMPTKISPEALLLSFRVRSLSCTIPAPLKACTIPAPLKAPAPVQHTTCCSHAAPSKVGNQIQYLDSHI